MDKKELFRKKLLATFKIEAQDHLSTVSACLIELEKTAPGELGTGIIERVLRATHSLKGAARAVNLMEVEAACQALEGVFAALKNREVEALPEVFDTLHHALDCLTGFLSANFEQEGGDRSRIRNVPFILQAALEDALLHKPPLSPSSCEDGWPASASSSDPKISGHPCAGEMTAPNTERAAQSSKGGESGNLDPESAPAEAGIPESADKMMELRSSKAYRAGLSETIRIPAARMDALLLQSEELLSAKLAGSQRIAELRKIRMAHDMWKREWDRTSSDIRRLLNTSEKSGGNGMGRLHAKVSKLAEMLDRNDIFLRAQESGLVTLIQMAEHDQRTFNGMLDHLLEGMKEALMLPFSSLLEVFPKIVRDLSRDRGKNVELEIQQEEIEVGRRILGEMKDPLIHMVRNCIDHGIEKPEERTRKNKPSRGKISIAVSPKDGSKVEITIADDGAGIDVQGVRDAALKAGVASPEEAAEMTDEECMLLIFESCVSTSSTITEISGRGLGLAIVREKVESLGGSISLESHRDAGATFRMVVPLSLATFQGVFVRVQKQLFVLPTIHAERVLHVSRSEIETVENRKAIRMNGKAVPLVSLADALEMVRRDVPPNSADRARVVVLSCAGKTIAFEVDEILHEQEVLVKGLGSQLSRVRNISGATVLGTGRVVPILNVPDLMKSALKTTSRQAASGIPPKMAESEKKSVLIAEDSITARVLLRSILEAAGYQVKTAVDGLDALTRLRTEGFDLVVSDVDMPRMNGFELTARIRAERRLANLPVVLVTALESREDREHGVEVGANAYINKSNFDQGDLLEIVRRLI